MTAFFLFGTQIFATMFVATIAKYSTEELFIVLPSNSCETKELSVLVQLINHVTQVKIGFDYLTQNNVSF